MALHFGPHQDVLQAGFPKYSNCFFNSFLYPYPSPPSLWPHPLLSCLVSSSTFQHYHFQNPCLSLAHSFPLRINHYRYPTHQNSNKAIRVPLSLLTNPIRPSSHTHTCKKHTAPTRGGVFAIRTLSALSGATPFCW